MMVRVGFGYDVHKLVLDQDLILGGVKIENSYGLLGHSDADVLIHAIIDSLFGSVAMRDIGLHFPDTDNQFRNISSLLLLEKTSEIIKNKYSDFEILNIDATIVMQSPKIANYIPQMIQNIAGKLKINERSVNVKATTTETLGFEGRKEGVSCYAITAITL